MKRVIDVAIHFIVNKRMNTVPFGKALYRIAFMFRDPSGKTIRYTDIKHIAPFVCQDVNVVGIHRLQALQLLRFLHALRLVEMTDWKLSCRALF